MATKTAISNNKKTTIEATDNSGRTMMSSWKGVYRSLKRTPIISIIIAEFIGTFIITAAFFEMNGRDPLTFAFVLAGVVLILNGVSGAHLNPAMTIGAWATKKISSAYALIYVASQVLGAATAWLVLDKFLQASTAATTSTVFHIGTITTGKEWCVFFAELLGTAIFALGVAMAIRIKKDRVSAAFATGLSAVAALYIAISVTSFMLVATTSGLTFLNPAIAIAGGLTWNLWQIAIFVLAPILGGIIGFVLQDFLQPKTDDNCDCSCCIKK
jgi:glycerol uptake facilitator-like aquaporin